jgi:hypothetical protein
MAIRHGILGAALFAVMPFTTAMAGDISGCVQFHDDGRTWPASFQPVTLRSMANAGEYGVLTDRDGCYYFRNIRNGRFEVVAEAGSDRQRSPVTVSGAAARQVPVMRLNW